MKKSSLIMALIASVFSISMDAQEKGPKQKKAKTEKVCTTEKKSCDKNKKVGCCASKKAKS